MEIISIEYKNKNGELTKRQIDTKRVSLIGDTAYIFAYCHLRKEDRTFKLDNIIKILKNGIEIDKDAYFDQLYKNQTGFTRNEEETYFSDLLKEYLLRTKDNNNAFEEITYVENNEIENIFPDKNIYLLINKIHANIKNLIWYDDGKFKNYEKKKREIITTKEGISFTIISDCEEPSLIKTTDKIEFPTHGEVISKPREYNPSYEGLTPKQKYVYFQYLQNPFILFNIKYMLILYYGLERHLFCGNFDEAFSIIQKLRAIYFDERFQNDSLNALIFMSIKRDKIDFVKNYIIMLANERKINIYGGYLLYCIYMFDIPMSSYLLLNVAKVCGYNKNYLKTQPEILEKSINEIIKAKYGKETFSLNNVIDKKEFNKMTKELFWAPENRSLVDNEFYVQDLTKNEKVTKVIMEIINAAHNVTKEKLKEIRKKQK